jgi:hypothetical protein
VRRAGNASVIRTDMARTLAPISLTVGGCSFDPGSLSPSSDHEEPRRVGGGPGQSETF